MMHKEQQNIFLCVSSRKSDTPTSVAPFLLTAHLLLLFLGNEARNEGDNFRFLRDDD